MSKPPAWAAEYIGIPFLERGRGRAGCDCWGLVRLVLAERFGIELPSHADDYETVKDHGRLVELIQAGKGNITTEAQRNGEAKRDGWLRAERAEKPVGSRCLCGSVVKTGWLEVERGVEQAGDVVLLRLRGLPVHVGIIVARGWMLHVEAKVDSVVERFDGLEWRNRILGIYRHDALAT
jgi:cell wall-associated NlpC family hydrolase